MFQVHVTDCTSDMLALGLLASWHLGGIDNTPHCMLARSRALSLSHIISPTPTQARDGCLAPDCFLGPALHRIPGWCTNLRDELHRLE